jgi:hypothetical protein
MSSRSRIAAPFAALTFMAVASMVPAACSGDDGETTAAGSGGSGGGIVGSPCDDTLDCELAGNGCNVGSCVDNVCVAAPAAAGTLCDEDDGSFCDGAGTCVACINDGQCAVEDTCVDNACVGPGGGNGGACTDPGDCPSGFCVDGECCDGACDAACQS